MANTDSKEIYPLKELVSTIMDYYCFKYNENPANFPQEEDDDEDDNFRKLRPQEKEKDSEDFSANIIPEEINSLIEESFKSQLRKFII